MDLAQFQWKNRLLFLFTPDGSNPLFKNLQSELRARQAEVKDRDLVVFEVFERDSFKMNTTPIDRQAADSIRGDLIDRLADLAEEGALDVYAWVLPLFRRNQLLCDTVCRIRHKA